MGIHELLVATDEIKRLIQKRSPSRICASRPMKDGMTTLLQDGIQKVVGGSHGLQAGPRGLHQVVMLGGAPSHPPDPPAAPAT